MNQTLFSYLSLSLALQPLPLLQVPVPYFITQRLLALQHISHVTQQKRKIKKNRTYKEN